MKRHLPLLFAFVAMVMLLGFGSIMNNACKTSPHAWCAPPPKIVRLSTAPSQEGDNLIGHDASRARWSSQV